MQVSRNKSLGKTRCGDEVTATIQVSGVVESSTSKNGTQVVRLTSLQMSNPYSLTSDGRDVVVPGKITLESQGDDFVLELCGGKNQRVVCNGLSDSERKSIAAAPTELLASTLATKSDAQRATLASSLLSSLTVEERKKLLSELRP
ncbi:hypothetical protein [Rubripirellula reticaptiva]|uniref:Uncharacterized protein n=1 Tax=Rubripirellula reticaptiva TaxID=2528013 RepID=A0A5C6EKU9_9BACT|nr:hypothetical protein [Rubripirellula reticaptiva]TWU49448.1 hypothetical protein Poly59_40630 [Rubripirellula reticaptiva]